MYRLLRFFMEKNRQHTRQGNLLSWLMRCDCLRIGLPQAAKNIKGLPMRKNIPKETFQQVKKSHCKAFPPHSSSLFL
jgi:hypothetical protein